MNSGKEVVTHAVPHFTPAFWIIVKCVYRYHETILMRTVGFSIYSMSLFIAVLGFLFTLLPVSDQNSLHNYLKRLSFYLY